MGRLGSLCLRHGSYGAASMSTPFVPDLTFSGRFLACAATIVLMYKSSSLAALWLLNNPNCAVVLQQQALCGCHTASAWLLQSLYVVSTQGQVCGAGAGARRFARSSEATGVYTHTPKIASPRWARLSTKKTLSPSVGARFFIFATPLGRQSCLEIARSLQRCCQI